MQKQGRDENRLCLMDCVRPDGEWSHGRSTCFWPRCFSITFSLQLYLHNKINDFYQTTQSFIYKCINEELLRLIEFQHHPQNGNNVIIIIIFKLNKFFMHAIIYNCAQQWKHYISFCAPTKLPNEDLYLTVTWLFTITR